jgi:PAS domain S-box-containing protein
MTDREPGSDRADDVRRRAEELVRGKAVRSQENLEALSPGESRRILHELQVHQIELEMQNEELRRVQAELEGSRARYFNLYDLAPVGYCTISEQGVILEANLTAATLLGVTKGEIVRQSLTCFIVREDQDTYYRLRQQLIGTGVPQKCDLRLYRKDAAPFWARLEVIASKDADGELVCRASIADITEHKESEKALRLSYERLQRFVDSNLIGVVIAKANGNVLYANDYYLNLIGVTRGDLDKFEVDWRAITPPEWISADEKAIQELRERGKCTPYEKEYLRRDGTRIPVLLMDAMLPGPDEQIAAFALDLTAQKQAEQRIRDLSDRLLRAEDEERRRIGEELHDCTIQELVAVMMNLGSLLDDHRIKDKETIKIEDSMAILDKCVNDIRTLSYLLHPPQLAAAGIVGALRHYAKGFGRRAGIAIVLDLQEEIGLIGKDVELVLYRVMQESLSNIHRHTNSLTAGIRLVNDANSLKLEVYDEGAGTPDSTRETVNGLNWEPGVGISGMQERLKRIGGRLEIESGSCGTTVRAIIPSSRGGFHNGYHI